RDAVLVYHERWEEELAFDEIKTHLSGRDVLLRSKTPRGVVQELYGLFLAHRIMRQVMLDAAGLDQTGPGRLSLTTSLRGGQTRAPRRRRARGARRGGGGVGGRGAREDPAPATHPVLPGSEKREGKKWKKKTPKTSPPATTLQTLC